jgi:hypothetical protein
VRTEHWQGTVDGRQWQATGSVRVLPGDRTGRVSAFGQQLCGDFEFSWQLTASEGWRPEALDVRVVGLGRGRRVNRTLLLQRGPDSWRATAWHLDGGELRPPGLAVPHGRGVPADADVVLDGCPLSHLPSLRRLRLTAPATARRVGTVPRALAGSAPVLRVRVPSLTVEVTRHRYTWVADVDSPRWSDGARGSQHDGSAGDEWGAGMGPRIVRLRHAFDADEPVALAVDHQGVPLEFGALRRRLDPARVA